MCASEPDGLAAGAGALPRARRRCEAGKRTHGPGPRACLALLAATALLALAAPAQAQTEIWSATLTPVDLGDGVIGCLAGVAACSSTAILSDDDFTHDSTDYTVVALYVETSGLFTFIVDATITTETAALTLVVGSTSLVLADATTRGRVGRIWASSGVSLTVGTAINVKLTAAANTQTEIWSATLTPVDLGDGVIGCLAGVAACSSTAILSDDDFTHDSTDYTVVALYVETSGLFTFIVDATITTETAALTLVVGSTSLVLADATTRGRVGRIWASSGVSLTVGTAINVKLTAAASTNTAPTVANTIPNQTATAGTAFSYAFLANTFADTDPGDTLTYTATQSDDTALPSWLSFAAATRTFSGTPTAADVGTVSVKVTASDGHGGSVSDTFDIVVSAAAGVTVSKSALTVTEEDTTGDSYTVVLDSQPTANVTVTVAGHAGTDVTPSPTSLTFTTTTWGTAQTVTVKAGNDTDTTNDTVTLTHSAASTDSNYGGITIGSVVVTVADNDTANTAPTAADKTVTTGEDRAYAFTADDFGFDDDDAGATLASVTIVTLPMVGTLALDGTAVMADDVVTTDQIDADMLTFTPARDAHGDPYTTFTFTVNDGTDDSASAYTMTIDVTDAPLPVCAAPSFGDRREIWTGTVTVERGESSGTVYYGFIEGVEGTLLPSQSFSIGSNNYVIDAILVGVNGTMEFSIGGFSSMTSKEGGALRLHVCDGDYDFITSFSSENTTTWLATTLDWSPPVVTRTVYLSLPANNAATGEPAITGTAQAAQDLTADASPLMDTDGLPSSFTYQWVRVDADGMSNPADITDATAATYTLTAADAGKKIKVQVSFTDELSGVEERTSAAYPSSGTVTAASTTAPALLSVTVTSTPHKTTDTYGAREHIEFSMTFDAPVTVTGDPTFAFDLGGASTATYYAGSGTTTLRFSHAVSGGSSGDRDTNGISWAENAIALNGGTIAGTDNAVAAVLTHVAQSNLAAHKVDGRTTAVTPATVTVAVTSTPTSLADTYGFGETIVITVTASEAVEVEGDPEFEFSMNNPGGAANDVPATYDRTRSSATTMVFTYTVQAGDMDSDGIWIGDPQPNLHAGRERPHPHGLAADRHRPQPSREGHAHRPQGGRIPGGADRTAGSHGADPGVGHRHDAHHRVDAPG